MDVRGGVLWYGPSIDEDGLDVGKMRHEQPLEEIGSYEPCFGISKSGLCSLRLPHKSLPKRTLGP